MTTQAQLPLLVLALSTVNMEKDLQVTLGGGGETVMGHSQILARDSQHMLQQILAPHNRDRHPKVVELPDVDKKTWEAAMKWPLPGQARAMRFKNVKMVHPFCKKCKFVSGVKICETIVEDILLNRQHAAKDVCKFCLEERMDSQLDRVMWIIRDAFNPKGEVDVPFKLTAEDINSFLSHRIFADPTEEEKEKCNIAAFRTDMASQCAFFHAHKVDCCDLNVFEDEKFWHLTNCREQMCEEQALEIIHHDDFAWVCAWWHRRSMPNHEFLCQHVCRNRTSPGPIFMANPELFHSDVGSPIFKANPGHFHSGEEEAD